MSDFWYEDELTPVGGDVNRLIEDYAKGENVVGRKEYDEIQNQTRGTVRVNTPWWVLLTKKQAPFRSYPDSQIYIVRLGYEFAIPEENYDRGLRFIYARCETFIWTEIKNQPQPKVYDVIPRQIYNGDPRYVTLSLGPELSLGDFKGSLGNLSTDILVGRVTPEIIGWTGESEMRPYWEIRPVNKELLGLQNFWVVIEVPLAGQAIRLATLVNAVMRTRLGPIAVGPKIRIWKNRQSIRIPKLSL